MAEPTGAEEPAGEQADGMTNNVPTPDPAAFAELMRAVVATLDTEEGHVDADALMVGLLRGLGYGDAMDIYESKDWWYA